MSNSQMDSRCSGSECIGIAILDHYSFFINERGKASIRNNLNEKVYGLVYLLSEVNELSLDRYEGIKTNIYRKMAVEV